jgi:photosystem II stability/assembly factor-like uncharacterized protein
VLTNGEVRNVKRIERILMYAIFVLVVAAMAIAPQVGAQRGGGGGGGAAGGGRGAGGQGRGGAGGAGGGGGTYGALRIRNIGPSMISGRIVSIAVDPTNKRNYFIAAASGGVWRTTNGGVTFTPVFDNEESYSIGFVTLDPKNPSTVWVGSGENNSQRSVSWGDGVYRSDDDGRTWRNMGLKKSEHIARVLIDPRDSNVVYVASQGPLWGPGGDRGVFKTTDGGKTWKNVFTISENTGVTDLVFEPGNPDVMYAAAYQRRRHVWTLIDGGPESGIYKSTDAGATWNKLRGGLPGGDVGRIGLGVSPAKPNLIYAEMEAAGGAGGVYASEDRGGTWEKRDTFTSSSPQYYSTIFVNPKNAEQIYVMDTTIMTSDDGGRTEKQLGSRSKHVDNHVVWIDPDETDHLLVGCDGGLYETFDRGENWIFKENLPLGQFYDVTADNGNSPFYYVYGGTQDNSSVGGPARTRNVAGIINADWFNTQGGDGFTSAVDTEDPNTIYAESQDGGMNRFDRKTGEHVDIVPSEAPGEPPLRWDWDSPLIVSTHQHTRIYFAANKVFRSDDRGDSWKAVSGDITRHLDRDSLPVMGKIWPPEAVAKNASTSYFGNATTLAESPKKESVLYVGTDDGLISVTDDGGAHWRKMETFPGVPDMTCVSRVLASSHDANTAYAAFDGHKSEDFKPYLLKTTDLGKTWTSIVGDLPEGGPVLAIAEDPGDANLIFVGTEYGLFFTTNGGAKWTRLRNGLPTIAVRDLHIQKQMGDLVIGTFGRSIWVLDDYTPLRHASTEQLAAENATIFPIRDAYFYIPANQFGGGGKAHLGEQLYTAENPPMGAMITYYVKTAPQGLRAKRLADERAAERDGGKIHYPTMEELRAEEEEEGAQIAVTITDANGAFVRQLNSPAAAGMRRVEWDMRSSPLTVPAAPAAGGAAIGGRGGRGGGGGGFGGGGGGPYVLPGKYKVSISMISGGTTTKLAGPVDFNVVALDVQPLSPAERAAKEAFQKKAAKLSAAVNAALEIATTNDTDLATIKRALTATQGADASLLKTTEDLKKRNDKILLELRGDNFARTHEQQTTPSISQRAGRVVQGTGSNTARPTKTLEDDYKYAAQAFAPVLAQLRQLVEVDLPKLDKSLDAAGVLHTPGRVPNWKDQ